MTAASLAAVGSAARIGAAPMQAARAVAPGQMDQMDQMDPLGICGDFPIAQGDVTYLNSALITPIPRQVAEAGAQFLMDKASRPLHYEEVIGYAEQTRAKFARLVNASPEEIALLFSTGDGANTVANGLQLQAGENVVVDELHYDTDLALFDMLSRARGVELRIVKHRDGAVTARDFEPFVDRRTRLLSVAWVSHQNGFRHDVRALAALAHAYGAYLYVDAIQAAGAIAIDVKAEGIDFLCANSYKWMMASYGVAPFYVRQGLAERLQVDRVGHENVLALPAGQGVGLRRDARRFEYSSRAYADARLLGASIDYLQQVGVARIEAHLLGLATRLQQQLDRQGHRLFTPIGNRSQIVTFYSTLDPQALKTEFARSRIDVTVRNNWVRVAPAAFNTVADVDRLLAVSDRLAPARDLR